MDNTVHHETETILHERAKIVTQFSPFYNKFLRLRSGENGDINIAKLFFVFNDAKLVLSYPSANIERQNFEQIYDLTPEEGIRVLSQQKDPFDLNKEVWIMTKAFYHDGVK